MRIISKKRFMPLALTLSLLVMMAMPIMPTESMAAEATVDLLTTSNFAVMAGATITNIGPTTISGGVGREALDGDIGVSPGAAITGFPPGTVAGAIHSNDAIAIQAQTDLVTAYNDAAGRSTTQNLTGTDLGGLTLTPGVYNFDTAAMLTGTLTLDGQNAPDPVFIFKVGSTLTTATGSNINLIRGARYCRTFWQVGSSATLGTGSSFVGHIFALTSITANSAAVVQGQLLARNGAVTLDSNTITNGFCAAAPAPASLHVVKHVINNNGRKAVAANFKLHVKTAGIDVAASPAAGAELPGTTYSLAPGAYVVSEEAFAGYTVGYSGDSDASGNITLAAGDNKTVTITNNDIAYSSGGGGGSSTQNYPPLINVIKTPEPLALTSGPGSVTYTYKINNPGLVSLSKVSVTDDKVSSVNYVSGDVNADKLLQTSEVWTYTGKANLKATTTNTAIAKGSANGMTATDIANATVVVTTTSVPVYPPLINIVKTPGPLALTAGPGSVTYTYRVNNIGLAALSNVRVTDDKVSPVKYVSGDSNADKLLQPNETWFYIAKTNLQTTTTNTATAEGSANGMTATDIAYATVIVTPPGTVLVTISGGQLPKTSTPWYNLLVAGAALMLIGAVGWRNRRRYE